MKKTIGLFLSILTVTMGSVASANYSVIAYASGEWRPCEYALRDAGYFATDFCADQGLRAYSVKNTCVAEFSEYKTNPATYALEPQYRRKVTLEYYCQ